MAYRYREVKCPWCDHVFMWNRDGREGIIIPEYRLKATGEFVEKVRCPKCDMVLIVLDHILGGIDIQDERIESINQISRN